MEAAMENGDILGNYLGLLSGLSRESKMKIVEALNRDIKNNVAVETGGVDKLYGSFISDKSAEEIISEIRADRYFDREAVSL